MILLSVTQQDLNGKELGTGHWEDTSMSFVTVTHSMLVYKTMRPSVQIGMSSKGITFTFHFHGENGWEKG